MACRSYTDWLLLIPPFQGRGEANLLFIRTAKRLARISFETDNESLQEVVSESLNATQHVDNPAALKAAICVLTDLVRQRWLIRVADDGAVEVRRPSGDLLDPQREKSRIRIQELVKRDEQLREPATQKFVKGMERLTIHRDRPVSVFSLFRDGRELADSLRQARNLPVQKQLKKLREIVDPYLQFVDGKSLCEHTGLRLQDIWRYFRHTWTNQYTSTPGRSVAFLVRDRAREFHPVIGIGAIGSPIIQIRERDAWIGWDPDTFLEFAAESTSADLGTWLTNIVETALSELFIEDFIEEQLVTFPDLRVPSADVVSRLISYSENQRKLHHRLVRPQDLKRSVNSDGCESSKSLWRQQAKTHLYRSKRALSLADMLRSRMVLQKYLSNPPDGNEVRALLETAEGRQVVKKVLRKAKADRVGIAMADITVCGAVAPYNRILGGKLVSMLSASPEVIATYCNKYVEQQSEIASSMAGRPIVRPSQLVFLGTTSLYGVGSSQYNRLRMPAERIGGEPGEQLAYLAIGKSESYGTSQFSAETVNALVALVQQSSNGQRVNSIFGEGVSPKLRKIRGGLDMLHFPTDALLQHGRQRIVYGVPLVRNLREYLLGMDQEPDYIFDMTEPANATVEIAHWWIERWLSMRIMSDDVLDHVKRHTLVRPVRHGARVVLPPDKESLLDSQL